MKALPLIKGIDKYLGHMFDSDAQLLHQIMDVDSFFEVAKEFIFKHSKFFS